METTNFSDARRNLKAVLDRVVDDADVTVITRRDAEDVVVMSLSEYNSWKETEYLLASPANARRLTEALAQARAGKTKPRPEFPLHAESVHDTPASYKTRKTAPRKKRPSVDPGKNKRR